jgi:hypothetical protein
MIFRNRAVRRRKDGTFIQSFHESIPELLVDLGSQLEGILDSDDPDLRRLFPTAYPDDPEKDAGYQILARSELADARRQSVATVRRTSNSELLTEDELTDWMALTNDLRLVIGTKLDVAEDETHEDLDPSDPRTPMVHIYHLLGSVLYEIVQALSDALPDTVDD